MITSRRSFLLGAGSLLAAPSIVRVASLMPVSMAAQSPKVVRAEGIFMGEGLPTFNAVRGNFYMRSDGIGFIHNGSSWVQLVYGYDRSAARRWEHYRHGNVPDFSLRYSASPASTT